MNTGNLLPIAALLAAAFIIVIVFLRFIRARSRSRHADDAKRPGDPPARPTQEQEDYLDSSHIMLSPGSGEAPGKMDKADEGTVRGR